MQAVQHSSSGVKFKGEAPVNQLVVVPGDVCGLPARDRDGSTAPCYTFPLRHVQAWVFLKGLVLGWCENCSVQAYFQPLCVTGGVCDLFG